MLLDEVVVTQVDHAGQPEAIIRPQGHRYHVQRVIGRWQRSSGSMLFRVQARLLAGEALEEKAAVIAELVHSADDRWRLRRIWE
ncbi:hypothetical protein ACIBG8_14725 [Nonomuraea sp. NPDC050556]|uniref:hypothetical protein n=1 Tax=Nonomuraea sp. NPDC050556 TaxID=3364369 RepID=UPI00378772A7